MIVYDKLTQILKNKNMQWRDLCEEGVVSVNMPTKFIHNRRINTDTINKVCEFLQVQPGDIMEWISEEDYNHRIKKNEIALIEQQIAELEAKKEKIQNK